MLIRWKKLQGVETNQLIRFVSDYSDPAHYGTVFSKAESRDALERSRSSQIRNFVHLSRFNNVKHLNNFLVDVNRRMKMNGTLITCTETLEQRKLRHNKKYGKLLAALVYPFDFLLKRVFPKLPLTRSIYFKLTRGRNRSMSKTEVLGRIVYAGFEIQHTEIIDGLLYIVSKKVDRPSTDPKPSHGMLLSIDRIGAAGKKIRVYKFRTMHPYAQYVQDYIYKKNALQDGGKFKNDFRITKWGRWMRRFWIDEIPMFWNLVKGDMKLVGVRPLSKHYLSLYTTEHRNKRIQSKPGLIPPFYADLPITLPEIMASESRYIDTYDAAGWRADLDYVVKAFNNILLKKARSA
jgi:lipopolysaccharide/colanic/teichoic acid biosynthesis glycosyltransferase